MTQYDSMDMYIMFVPNIINNSTPNNSLNLTPELITCAKVTLINLALYPNVRSYRNTFPTKTCPPK